MRFAEWMRLVEITAASKIDTSGVELKMRGSKPIRMATYVFRDPSGGPGEYKVNMGEVEPGNTPFNMDGVWDISFNMDGGYHLRGNVGSGGTAVYGKVLSALKKLMETETVNGFKFFGFHQFMDVVYDRFAKEFGFVPAGRGYFYRKDVAEKSGQDRHFSDAARTQDKNIGDIRTAKSSYKAMLKDTSKIIGKIVGFQQNSPNGLVYPAIVMEVNPTPPGLIQLLVYRGPGSVLNTPVDSNNLQHIVSPRKIFDGLVDDLIQNVLDSTEARLGSKGGVAPRIRRIGQKLPSGVRYSISQGKEPDSPFYNLLPISFDGSTHEPGFDRAPTFSEFQ
jgi:hypothetical protein